MIDQTRAVELYGILHIANLFPLGTNAETPCVVHVTADVCLN